MIFRNVNFKICVVKQAKNIPFILVLISTGDSTNKI